MHYTTSLSYTYDRIQCEVHNSGQYLFSDTLISCLINHHNNTQSSPKARLTIKSPLHNCCSLTTHVIIPALSTPTPNRQSPPSSLRIRCESHCPVRTIRSFGLVPSGSAFASECGNLDPGHYS